MLTIAIIGAGYWGKNLIRILGEITSVHLKYIADNDRDILKNYSDNINIIKTNDYHTIMDDREVDAVVISSPAITHYKIAREALLSGKHVFVEKPMTLNVKHSEELVRTADEKGLKLMVGHLMLYHPCIIAIKDFLKNGEIGELYYLHCQRLNFGRVRSDENVLLSFAPHDISVALYLIGENPVSVSAYGQCYLQRNVEDIVFLNMYFSENKIAHAHVSWLDPHKLRRTTVVGSDRMIVFDDMEPEKKVKIYNKGVGKSGMYGSYGEFLSIGDGDIYTPDINMTEPLKLECEHFIDCIENNRDPKSDGLNGLAVTKVLEAAQKSLKEGGIPIDLAK